MIENGDVCSNCNYKSMPYWNEKSTETARMCQNKDCCNIEIKYGVLVDSPGSVLMSPAQEKNLSYIKSTLLDLIELKYRKGDKEHKGDLMNFSASDLLDNTIEEAIDQLVYLLTLKAKVDSFPSSSIPH